MPWLLPTRVVLHHCRNYSRERWDRGISSYGRSHRKRDSELYPSDDVREFVPGAHARHSPLEQWDPTVPDVPPPKTPSASPGREELVDYYPVAPPPPPPAEAMYDAPPFDAVKHERQNVTEDVSSGPDGVSTLSAGEDSGRKTERFEVIAPAFPAVESSATDAPSKNDIQAILEQAHTSSKATASFRGLVDMRRKGKLKEEQNRIKQEKVQTVAATHGHVSRPSTASRLKTISGVSASSIILTEGVQSAKKSGTTGLTVTPGKNVRGTRISSDDDSEEVDVDTIADDLSTLPISIPLHHLPASQAKLANKSSLDSRFLPGPAGPGTVLGSLPSDPASKQTAKKKKKKKKDKKKEKEDSLNMVPSPQVEGGGGIKMKINLTKKKSSLYE